MFCLAIYHLSVSLSFAIQSFTLDCYILSSFVQNQKFGSHRSLSEHIKHQILDHKRPFRSVYMANHIKSPYYIPELSCLLSLFLRQMTMYVPCNQRQITTQSYLRQRWHKSERLELVLLTLEKNGFDTESRVDQLLILQANLRGLSYSMLTSPRANQHLLGNCKMAPSHFSCLMRLVPHSDNVARLVTACCCLIIAILCCK